MDLVFKAMFASETDDSNEALKDFLGSILNRAVEKVLIRRSEPPALGLREKSLVYDVFATFDNQEDADIEMQMYLTSGFGARIEYNMSKLFTTQEIKGKQHEDLKPAYVIVVLANGRLLDSPDFMNEFMHRNKNAEIFTQSRTRIIFMDRQAGSQQAFRGSGRR
jgi:predicted transposase/invertase (TIGR01784 family)